MLARSLAYASPGRSILRGAFLSCHSPMEGEIQKIDLVGTTFSAQHGELCRHQCLVHFWAVRQLHGCWSVFGIKCETLNFRDPYCILCPNCFFLQTCRRLIKGVLISPQPGPFPITLSHDPDMGISMKTWVWAYVKSGMSSSLNAFACLMLLISFSVSLPNSLPSAKWIF